jgi:hypothetical protein
VKKLLLAAIALIALAPAAHAANIPVLDTVTLVGTDYEFSYSATLSGDTGVVAGNRLVIFDFRGYVPGSISSGIYAFDLDAFVELTTAGLTLPPGYDDDPNVENLVFQWKGAPFNASGGPFADVSFSGLTARSIYPLTAIDAYSAVTRINNGGATGLAAFNQGEVGVPVPEPSTLALVALGFGLAGSMRRTRRG